MSIIPVKFVANGREVKAFAFLDIGSDATFCHTKLAEKLGLLEKLRCIQINTLGGTRRPEKLDETKFISYMEIKSLTLKKQCRLDHIPVWP